VSARRHRYLDDVVTRAGCNGIKRKPRAGRIGTGASLRTLRAEQGGVLILTIGRFSRIRWNSSPTRLVTQSRPHTGRRGGLAQRAPIVGRHAGFLAQFGFTCRAGQRGTAFHHDDFLRAYWCVRRSDRRGIRAERDCAARVSPGRSRREPDANGAGGHRGADARDNYRVLLAFLED